MKLVRTAKQRPLLAAAVLLSVAAISGVAAIGTGLGSYAFDLITPDWRTEPSPGVDVSGSNNILTVINGDVRGSIQTLGPTASPQFAIATPTGSLDACGVTRPINHSAVRGGFTIEGHCIPYAGGEVFTVVRNLHADAITGGPGPWWIQCKALVKTRGDFVCSGFTCVPQTDYEVAVVFPPVGSYELYANWLAKESSISKYELPGDFDLIGDNLVLWSDDPTGSPPEQCGTSGDVRDK